MIRRNKGKALVSSLLILLPMAVGVLLWQQLPEQVAIHWGPSGAADGWAGRSWAVFVPPLFLFAIHWLCLGITAADPRNRQQDPKMVGLIFWLVPVIGLVVCGSIYAVALGSSLSPAQVIPTGLGVLFLIIGNYLPKVQPNYTIGFKLPWTLNSRENWHRTHRLAGRLWVIGGGVLILVGLLPLSWAIWVQLGIFLIMALVPMVYSYCFYRREEQER